MNSLEHKDRNQGGDSHKQAVVDMNMDEAFTMQHLQLEWMTAVLRSYTATELLRMLNNDGFKAFSRAAQPA